MSVFCKVGWHRWRHHGENPDRPDRRRCLSCSRHEHWNPIFDVWRKTP